jgi:hypothetical protein
MRRCAKCSLTFPDAAKICRSCGAILDDIVDTPPHLQMSSGQRDLLESIAQQVLSAADSPPADETGEQYFWKCSHCAEEVPGSFDVCWSCGTDRNGVLGPRLLEEVTESELEPDLPPSASETAARDRVCSCKVCGSAKIVPNAQVLDHGRPGGKLQLVVLGAPDALIFKDQRWGEITADICGDCGHLELRVHNAKELYDHYLNSLDHRDG